jgi:UDP-glucuronate 4-epimerase
LQVLVTGVAGFIGMHIAKRLLENGCKVVGIDNLNDYYDIELKKARLSQLNCKSYDFEFEKIDINETEKISNFFKKHKFELVIHLAAQAGVRYSIENPHIYIDTNIKGFLNILESCKDQNINNLIYASSSSVYGNNSDTDFKELDNTNEPISLYGATKKSNELMAFTYSNLYNINIIGLRFFTVYGPWGRPDMALFKFTHAILQDNPIQIYNNGKMIRDFTYIDDVVESVSRIVMKIKENSLENVKHNIYNIGSENPMPLMDYITVLEKTLGKSAKKIFIQAQLGDVTRTSSNSSKLYNWINYKPKTEIKAGIKNFVNWFKDYYKI